MVIWTTFASAKFMQVSPLYHYLLISGQLFLFLITVFVSGSAKIFNYISIPFLESGDSVYSVSWKLSLLMTLESVRSPLRIWPITNLPWSLIALRVSPEIILSATCVELQMTPNWQARLIIASSRLCPWFMIRSCGLTVLFWSVFTGHMITVTEF